MRKALCLCCLGLVASLALADGQNLQALNAGKALVPQRIGQLGPDGTVVQWMDYGTRQECEWVLVWDTFDPDPLDGSPCCGEDCGLPGPSYRWYFGETYCNLYISGDMQFDDANADFAERLELGWFWYVTGAGSGENMAIIVEFYEDFDDTCTVGDDGLGDWLGGVILDFGFADSGSGAGYYYTDVDLCGLDWLPFQADQAGAYNIWFATYDDADPDTLLPATCAQPMLWGTGEDETVPDDRPGSQGPIQWDDDFPPDWTHLVPDECYDYTFGICPDPLSAMACFYDASGGGGGCVGDLDGDGDTDQSDLGVLLADWDQDTGAGDLNGDGETDQQDLGILLGDWGCGT